MTDHISSTSPVLQAFYTALGLLSAMIIVSIPMVAVAGAVLGALIPSAAVAISKYLMIVMSIMMTLGIISQVISASSPSEESEFMKALYGIVWNNRILPIATAVVCALSLPLSASETSLAIQFISFLVN